MVKTIVLAFIAMGIGACGGDDGCKDNEVELDYFVNHEVDHTQCKPLPASCNGVGDCSAMTCIRDMYNLCDTGFLADACSDTFPPTIISCH
jgi:hypothetical protein